MDKSRRPSMAERRASVQTERNNLFIPHLAGIEKPETSGIPEKCDVVIQGTGLVESILAAALAWSGSQVIHCDANPYYGDHSATLTIDQLRTWVQNVNHKKAGVQGFSNAQLHIPGNRFLSSKDYGIDLSPKILFAQSDLLSLLVKSRVYRYLEFQSLSNFHVFENDSFGRMASTKQDIFTDQSLTLLTKRQLMKFIKFVMSFDSKENLSIWQEDRDKPLKEFIETSFKLEKPQINELVFSIGLSSCPSIKTSEGLLRIKRFLSSFDVYGSFPVLFSKFGGPGEISQGFCRSAAVAGAVYKLNTVIEDYQPESKIASFSDGSKVVVNDKLIASPSQFHNEKLLEECHTQVSRLITAVKNDCKEWFQEGENAAVVVFPPNSLQSQNQHPIHVLIQEGGSGVCPKGECLWYISTIEKGDKARKDLEFALLKLEESLLRESEFDVNLNEEDVVYKPNGLPVINSVKLGQSFKEFVPKEKVTYLFKLFFTQVTAVPPFGVVSSEVFDRNSNLENLVYSNMPSTEFSYDGAVTEAKMLYAKVVGSEDDFFDVDFEDDDDMAPQKLQDEVLMSEDEIPSEKLHAGANFKDEMEFEL